MPDLEDAGALGTPVDMFTRWLVVVVVTLTLYMPPGPDASVGSGLLAVWKVVTL